MKTVLLSLASLLLLAACATKAPKYAKVAPPPKEFAPGEVVLAQQLLNKIFDQDMATLACVPDTEEAALLLRTIGPRLEMVQDDFEAKLDVATDIEGLIEVCDQNCTCQYIDDLFREHLVMLTKPQRKNLDQKKKIKDLNSCLNYAQSTFCQSELYQALNKEKIDFSFEAP